MAKALTTKGVENAAKGASRREIPDGASTGLWLVIQPSGAKSWAFRYRSPVDRKPKKLTIGSFPAFSLVDARKEAAAAQQLVEKLIDPAAQKRAAKATAAEPSDRVDALLNSFIARHIERELRSSSAREAKRLIERHLRPAWKDRRADSLTRHDVLSLAEEISEAGAGTTANRVFSLCRLFMNWLVNRGVIDTSPMAGMRAPVTEKSRDRVLTDAEIRLLWLATGESTPFNAAVRTLLLTGQRRGEVKDMVTTELRLSADAPLWSLPPGRVKNATAHDVPLSPAAVAAIASAPKIDGSTFVFTLNGENAINGWSKSKTQLDGAMLALARKEAKDAGVNDLDSVTLPHWTLHDLRRTCASALARLGTPVHITEAVLNHRSGTLSGITRVYQKYDFAKEKRDALEAWARFVLGLVNVS